ncbi:hypothetical protein [Brevundimonas sp. A19_0]|uniref:hypothetical protein n=1 Tax=Brevundimonas sp. A19_0 TaxID=2821087 RepID=UPI001ADA45A1|nr:hypothetical protein [Brevundimonas sp. A19_0]MBO9500649.1 hypothetical protein [Brevundimonas sp. A19_0]
MKRIMVVGACGLLLAGTAGCDRLSAAWEGFNNPGLAERPSDAPSSKPTPTPGGSLVEAGQAVVLQPETDDALQTAAAVVALDYLPDQGDLTAKMFGTAGGDPAMNGLYTYIAFFHSPAEGWRVFRIGDYLEYQIQAVSAGRVELMLNESVMDQATGEIGSRQTAVILSFAPGPDGAVPETVTVTPAR